MDNKDNDLMKKISTFLSSDPISQTLAKESLKEDIEKYKDLNKKGNTGGA